jgi:hypothetical protein
MMKTFKVYYAPINPEGRMVFEVEAETEDEAVKIADKNFQVEYSRDLWKDYDVHEIKDVDFHRIVAETQ